MDQIFLLDSNMLVYAYDLSEPKKRKIIMKLIEECWNNKRKLCVSVQNLSEFYTIVTKKIQNPIEKNEAKRIVEEIIKSRNWIVLDLLKENILDGVEFSINFNCSYWDSLLAATILKNNVFNIYTENSKDFNKIQGIKVVNPFK